MDEDDWAAEICRQIEDEVDDRDRKKSVTSIVINGPLLLERRNKMLVAGGSVRLKTYEHTEIFDFSTGRKQGGPNMLKGRCAHASCTLSNGDIVVFGGVSDSKVLSCCEILFIGSSRFRPLGQMCIP